MADKLTKAVAERTVNELWWVGTLQGTLAIFFGITAIFWPALTLVTLVYLFSAFVLAVGIVEIVSGIMSADRRSTWWLTLLLGVIGVAVGVYLVRHPDVSFATFILLIGLSLIARGVLDVVRAFVDDISAATRTLSVLVGIVAVVAGIVILLQPVTGGVAFVWILGLYAIIFGSLALAISFALRNELSKALGLDSEEPEPAPRRRSDHSTPAPTHA